MASATPTSPVPYNADAVAPLAAVLAKASPAMPTTPLCHLRQYSQNRRHENVLKHSVRPYMPVSRAAIGAEKRQTSPA
jgi:hypothetical protein